MGLILALLKNVRKATHVSNMESQIRLRFYNVRYLSCKRAEGIIECYKGIQEHLI